MPRVEQRRRFDEQAFLDDPVAIDSDTDAEDGAEAMLDEDSIESFEDYYASSREGSTTGDNEMPLASSDRLVVGGGSGRHRRRRTEKGSSGSDGRSESKRERGRPRPQRLAEEEEEEEEEQEEDDDDDNDDCDSLASTNDRESLDSLGRRRRRRLQRHGQWLPQRGGGSRRRKKRGQKRRGGGGGTTRGANTDTPRTVCIIDDDNDEDDRAGALVPLPGYGHDGDDCRLCTLLPRDGCRAAAEIFQEVTTKYYAYRSASRRRALLQEFADAFRRRAAGEGETQLAHLRSVSDDEVFRHVRDDHDDLRDAICDPKKTFRHTLVTALLVHSNSLCQKVQKGRHKGKLVVSPSHFDQFLRGVQTYCRYLDPETTTTTTTTASDCLPAALAPYRTRSSSS